MRLRLILVAATFGGFLAGCLAQELVLTGPTPVQLKVVKNSPFSAQVVTQSTQELADGNRIIHNGTTTIARDSEGRTRREGSTAAFRVVFIQDPVAGLIYVLDSNSRLARRIATPNSETSQSAAEVKVETAGKTEPSDIKSESLGSQLVEGIQADGTRITRTIPIGQAGNNRPVDVVSETWYSTELQTIVMSKNIDPRLGETAFKLTDIRRTEPDHSLFEVPNDYTVLESLNSKR